jgi:hypothetical protein
MDPCWPGAGTTESVKSSGDRRAGRLDRPVITQWLHRRMTVESDDSTAAEAAAARAVGDLLIGISRAPSRRC